MKKIMLSAVFALFAAVFAAGISYAAAQPRTDVVRTYNIPKDINEMKGFTAALNEQGIWASLLEIFSDEKKVGQLIFVKNHDVTSADVVLYEKVGDEWKQTMNVQGKSGKNGIARKDDYAGPGTTPIGAFAVLDAFGTNPNPGTKLPYTRIDENLYLCGDIYNNKLIDIRDNPHDCKTCKRLIDYDPEFRYGILIDFDSDSIPDSGSAISLHCSGSGDNVDGSVTIAEKDMAELLRRLAPGAVIAIYDRDETASPKKSADIF